MEYRRLWKDDLYGTKCSKVNFLRCSDKVVIMGDFNSKEVDWDNRTTTGDNSWGVHF